MDTLERHPKRTAKTSDPFPHLPRLLQRNWNSVEAESGLPFRARKNQHLKPIDSSLQFLTPAPPHQNAPFVFGCGTKQFLSNYTQRLIPSKGTQTCCQDFPIHFHTFHDYCSEIEIL
ncbi:hypothetical protein CEXT_387951 [Caerostris extrusa]|uniref:Uncharacterized protein n=1 Tax=Caerostris extrusa TaxID=172846 RepID=A0AAV4U8B5_CAEEX|nr:hypothetical protein CEXT_387951 [Caerostris extrusa]